MCKKKLTIEEFIEKANKKHFNKYNYSKVNYINGKIKILIVCKEHGDFMQIPKNHLNGAGCQQCGQERIAFSVRNTNSIFILKASKIHKDKYKYSSVKYKNNKTKVKIICNIHGIFEQTPSSHLNGNGCIKCRGNGFVKSQWIKIANKNNKSMLYIIKCYNENEIFIKIGITSQKIQKRFYGKDSLPYKYNILKTVEDSPNNIWNKEKFLHKKFKKFKYKPKINFGGSFECFNLNVLKTLDDHIFRTIS